MGTFARKAVSLAQWGAGLAALVWAMSDVDFSLLVSAMGSWTFVSMLPVFALSALDYFCMGLRLHALMPAGTGRGLAMRACLLCVGMNCLLPAKAGDGLKILYLARNTGHSFADISSVVIWERLCDVIFLSGFMLVAMCNADAERMGTSLVLPVAVLVACAAGFAMLRHWSSFFHALYARFLPNRLASPLSHLHTSLVDRVSLPWVARGFAWSLGTWGPYFLSFVFSLEMADIHLTIPQCVVVFTVACLGTAIPSLPGGIGLFEGAVVLGLSWYGVADSEALGVALFFHAVHFLPLAAAAIVINGRARYWRPAPSDGGAGAGAGEAAPAAKDKASD